MKYRSISANMSHHIHCEVAFVFVKSQVNPSQFIVATLQITTPTVNTVYKHSFPPGSGMTIDGVARVSSSPSKKPSILIGVSPIGKLETSR